LIYLIFLERLGRPLHCFQTIETNIKYQIFKSISSWLSQAIDFFWPNRSRIRIPIRHEKYKFFL